MKTIQMTIDDKLLEDVDKLTAQLETTRSAFVRSALQAAIKKHRIREAERKYIESYTKQPQQPEEYEIDEVARDWGDDW
ncbi:MAG: ribbon-helix-helix protein, CopG family [Thermaceae bacterium]|nr:ribbon-helix-helix protein, CopG family [Thermaceae bacterium]